MLLAFVEELGHEYEELLEGASCSKDALLIAASSQVKKTSPCKTPASSDDDSGSGSESEEDGEDGDIDINVV